MLTKLTPANGDRLSCTTRIKPENASTMAIDSGGDPLKSTRFSDGEHRQSFNLCLSGPPWRLVDKAQLRIKLLQQRRQLPVAQWQQQSLELCANLQQWSVFQQASRICAYFSTQREADLQPLFEHLGKAKHWGFPRCVQKNLVWHPWQWGQPLTTGAYGIKVPTDQTQTWSPTRVDLLLVPCLAGDRQGYRLGYGGGYYDRLFTDPLWRSVPKAGILFEAGLREKLPHDPWDIPLQTLVTEKQIIEIDGG